MKDWKWLTLRASLELVCLVIFTQSAFTQQRTEISANLYARMPWRYIGPEGNRVSAVAGVPGDPLVYYAGSASGGIFKTADGGVTFQPIFDEQTVSSIGSIAVAPSDPATVWVGTGEPWIRSHISVGEGIFKSTDAGKTWTRMGLDKTGRIAKVVIDPHNPDIVLACSLGHAYGPQPERGVFRTTDGGKSWNRVLFADEKTGCSGLTMDPKNPRRMLAGMWTLEIHTWGLDSGGPGSGLYSTNDGGLTWKRLQGRGLPGKPVGKTIPVIAPSNPNRVYALIETGDGIPLEDGTETDRGEVFRSDDGGDTWRVVSYDRNAMGRSHYYGQMFVAPDNENETYYLSAAFSVSLDGGQNLTQMNGAEVPGGDHHAMWIDPLNPQRMAVGHDQGFSISNNRGKTWMRLRLPNAQMYHVTTDNEIPYNVFGNKQDGPSYRGPSNSRLGGRGSAIPRSAWHTVGGGESGWATPDPLDSNIIWSTASGSGSVGGIVVRYEENRRQFRNVEVWPDQSNGPASGVKYRFVWTAPFHMSPHDRNTLYIGSQYVHRTTNGGQSWEVISPDLSLNDRTRMKSSGGLTPDNIGVEYGGVVFAIAESPKEKGLIWAGTNDGLVHLTRDNGKTWTNVTKNIPDLPVWGTISNIEPSRYDAGTAYLTVDFHQVNNRDPFIYKTTDFGKTWKMIVEGIPKSNLSYAHCVREDPKRRGLLYVGTENGIYLSYNDGENWQPLQTNLPHAPVYWITVQEHFNDLLVATYGRGFWIMDDISPIQQLTPLIANGDTYLFPPRATYRFREITAPGQLPDDPTTGQNAPYGAPINYYLKSVPAGDVKIAILDAKNEVIRTIDATKNIGLNRVYWDLDYEASKQVRFRTSPLYAPEIPLGPEGFRAGGNRLSVLAAPGTYTVRLTVGGKDFTQKLELKKDPNSGGTEADIADQMRMLFDIHRDMDHATDDINSIEVVRSQIYNLTRLTNDEEVKKASDTLDKRLIEAESELIDLRLTGRGQDGVRWGSRLLGKLSYLASGLASADFKPTDQQRDVQKDLEMKLQRIGSDLDNLLSSDLGTLNTVLRRKNMPNVMAHLP
jgi:photosystem II stability/assembly factor-like uncharacterized protein